MQVDQPAQQKYSEIMYHPYRDVLILTPSDSRVGVFQLDISPELLFVGRRPTNTTTVNKPQ